MPEEKNKFISDIGKHRSVFYCCLTKALNQNKKDTLQNNLERYSYDFNVGNADIFLLLYFSNTCLPIFVLS